MALYSVNMDRMSEGYSQPLYPGGAEENYPVGNGASGSHREALSLQLVSSEQCAEVLQLQPKISTSMGKHSMYHRGPYNLQMEKLRQISQPSHSPPMTSSHSLESVSRSSTPAAGSIMSDSLDQITQDYHTSLAEKQTPYHSQIRHVGSRENLVSQSSKSQSSMLQHQQQKQQQQQHQQQHQQQNQHQQHQQQHQQQQHQSQQQQQQQQSHRQHQQGQQHQQQQQQQQHESPHGPDSPGNLMKKQTISYLPESPSQESQQQQQQQQQQQRQKDMIDSIASQVVQQSMTSHGLSLMTSGQPAPSRPGRKPKSAQQGDSTLLGSLSGDPSQRPSSAMGEKTCVCMVCFKLFRNKPQLTQHELVHNGIRKHTCSYCDKSFKQLCHLQQHIRIHTGERPYKCNVETCQRSFAQLSNLQHHLRNHEEHVRRDNAKQFRCVICDRSYTTESSLKAHTLKLHVNIKPVDPLVAMPQKKKRKKKNETLPVDPKTTIVVDISSSDDEMPPVSSAPNMSNMSAEQAHQILPRSSQFPGSFVTSSSIFNPHTNVSSLMMSMSKGLRDQQAATAVAADILSQTTAKGLSSVLHRPSDNLSNLPFGMGGGYPPLSHHQMMPPGSLAQPQSQSGPMGSPFLGPGMDSYAPSRMGPPGQPWPLYVSSESSFSSKSSDRRNVLSSPHDFRITPSPSSPAPRAPSTSTSVSSGQQ